RVGRHLVASGFCPMGRGDGERLLSQSPLTRAPVRRRIARKGGATLGGTAVGSAMNTPPTARLASLASAVCLAAGASAQHTVTVATDDVVIDRSCRVVIPAGTVIEDANGNGVIHIRANGVTVEFARGSVLRGAAEGTPWDE